MRGEVQWLRDMVLSCHLIGEYLSGQSFETFETDHLRRDAVCFRLAVIGESVGQVIERLDILLPSLPWTTIKAMRNLVLHDYFRIDWPTIWETASRDVPRLLESLRAVVRPEE